MLRADGGKERRTAISMQLRSRSLRAGLTPAIELSKPWNSRSDGHARAFRVRERRAQGPAVAKTAIRVRSEGLKLVLHGEVVKVQ